MSFNNSARKVLNAELSPWMRWSQLHSCLLRVVGARSGAFPATRERWIREFGIGPNCPPTDEQLRQAVEELRTLREERLKQLRVYEEERKAAKRNEKRFPVPPMP